MDSNKILFQKCISLRTPQKAAVQQPAANLLHLQTFLASSAKCRGQAKTRAHRIGVIAGSMNWVLMLKLHYRAGLSRMTLGKPFCQFRLSYLHLQNRAQSLLRYGGDTRCALFTFSRWEGVSGCHCWHMQLHTQVSVHVSSLPLHEGSWYCSGAPPEHGL